MKRFGVTLFGLSLFLTGIAFSVLADDDGPPIAFRKALQQGDRKTVATLLAAGLDVNANYQYETMMPLWFYAVDEERPDFLALCFRYGADIRRTAQHDETGLMLALIHKNTTAVEFLVRAAKIASCLEARDDGGKTALRVASDEDRPDYVRLLLAAGADPNAVDARGDTALIVCLRTDRLPTAGLLLRAGADCRRPDANGNTPLAVAAVYGRFTALPSLFGHGATGETPNRFGYRPRLCPAPRARAGRGRPAVTWAGWERADGTQAAAKKSGGYPRFRFGDTAQIHGRTRGLMDGETVEIVVWALEKTGKPVEFSRGPAAVKAGAFIYAVSAGGADAMLETTNGVLYFDVNTGDRSFPGPPCVFRAWLNIRIVSDERPIRLCHCIVLGDEDRKTRETMADHNGRLILEDLDVQTYHVVVGKQPEFIDRLARYFPTLR